MEGCTCPDAYLSTMVRCGSGARIHRSLPGTAEFIERYRMTIVMDVYLLVETGEA